MVPVPAGVPDPQLVQLRESQARLDEGAGTLVPIRRDIRQEWAVQPPAGEARHLAQNVQHRITDDARARLPPASSGVGQNLATAAMLIRAMPEPSTTEGRRIQGELKNLLEGAAARRAESLIRAMPEPSTTEGRRIQGELKNLLEGAVARRAESTASRRQ